MNALALSRDGLVLFLSANEGEVLVWEKEDRSGGGRVLKEGWWWWES